MQRMLKSAVALALATALLAPVAASADDAALAQERYYSSYSSPFWGDDTTPTQAGEPTPSATPVPAATSAGDDTTWKVLAIGAGALALVLAGAELVTLARLRRLSAT